MIEFAPRHNNVCSVDAFVIHGPNPMRSDYEDEKHWMLAVDIGLTDAHRGFQSRKELAYELTRLLAHKKLPEAGFIEKKFVHHDYGMEHLYIVVEDYKKDGTLVDPEALKVLMKQAVEEVNTQRDAGSQLITFVEKSWDDINMSILNPQHKRGWSVE